ncbi:MAG: ester cyclase [Solirubrobacterales bacterium]
MSIEINCQTVRDCFEQAALGNFDELPAILTPDFVMHNPDEVHGADGLAAMVQQYRGALSDLSVTIDHQFATGDWVASRFTIRGTHDGSLMGVPPSGRDVTFTGITISRCRDGQIAEEWELTDTVGLLGQVGALPATTQG